MDVSKLELYLHTYNHELKLPSFIKNTPSTIKKLITKLQKQSGVICIFEATGGYEKTLLTLLQNKQIDASRINPALARNFAKAKGLLAKTDAIDAQILTDYGIQFTPRITPVADPVFEEVHALVKYRRQLNDELQRARMQLEHPLPKSVLKMLNARIKYLKKHIEKATTTMTELKDESSSLKQVVEKLTDVKGVACDTALSLVVAMPELGILSSKQAASLAGLAPFNRDSGQLRGKRIIQGGRKEIRQALYMAALAASRSNEVLSPYYKQLLERGKPKKLALTAVMRKLLLHLNTLMKQHLETPNHLSEDTV
ncbi:MAG: IS110 family transposase [Akkermansiaceae bacterium]